jgi:16S rRNA (guanine527-N7)-methyltransferase
MAADRPLPDPADGALPAAELWQRLGWRPDDEQLARFAALQGLLRQWNTRLNLTRLVEGDDYWIAQVFDSLWPLRDCLDRSPGGVAPPRRWIDVGTGGGFPGLAVAIALPDARVTLVDSVGRKVEAVRAMVDELGLSERVRLRCERVESTGRAPHGRGRFDRALARAVAGAPVVAEYLIPLLAGDGRALLYRGQWDAADQERLEAALKPLNARLERVERLDLPAGRGVRHCLVLRPRGPCPAAYPRAVGVPARLPLGQPARN